MANPLPSIALPISGKSSSGPSSASRRSRLIGATLIFFATVTTLILPWEPQLELAFAAPFGSSRHIVAGFLSWMGRMDTIPLLGVFALFALGWAGRKRVPTRIAIAFLQVIALSGVLANLGKVLFGRARPNAGISDGFHGPSFSHALQSFPSGHTASAAAVGALIFLLSPRFGWIGLLYGSAVGWSRLALKVHHPSDVLAGLCLGWICAILVARHYRRPRDLRVLSSVSDDRRSLRPN